MSFNKIKRREFLFITLLGGAAAAWPPAARAQQRGAMRRIGMLLSQAADDPEQQYRAGAFLQALQELGWTLGRNLRIDYRYVAGNIERYRPSAAELVALSPDVIVTSQGALVSAVRQAGGNLPIVFVAVIDPVG